MITIDGSKGEGGGQVLRSSLSLSMVTGQPFRIKNIRAGRTKPGLLRQHLTCVRASEAVCGATVEGAELGSKEIVFRPGAVQPGLHTFAVGTAGSAMLVLQTVLPPLMLATETSTVTVEGGTHNDHAPPFDFLEHAFVPLLRRMGGKVDLILDGYGFYPAGGGRVIATISPAGALSPLHLMERGALKDRTAIAIVANLPGVISKLELAAIAAAPGWADTTLVAQPDRHSPGPGNALLLVLEHDSVTEVFTSFGQRGVKSERVAANVIAEADAYLSAPGAVGAHLADQLLLPMAIGNGGRFTTTEPTLHTRTNADIIQRFLDVEISLAEISPDLWEVVVK